MNYLLFISKVCQVPSDFGKLFNFGTDIFMGFGHKEENIESNQPYHLAA